MSSSGGDGAGNYLGNQLASAQFASQIGAQMQSRIFGINPDTMSTIHKLTGVSSQFEALRTSMLDKLFPSMELFSTFNSELFSPTLSETYARLAGVNTAQYAFAQSPEFQNIAMKLAGMTDFNSVLSPALSESMRNVIGTSQFPHAIFDTPAMSETFAKMGQINADLGNFAQIYSQTTQPLMDSLRATYEDSKLLDSLDLSVLDDVDEDAFEDFLEEHPELEETYETIERSLIGEGLISKATLRSAGSRFKSSRVGRHLLIAVVMFGAAAAIYFGGVKSLPDEMEDDALTYLGVVGFLYTAYAVHASTNKTGNPTPEEQ